MCVCVCVYICICVYVCVCVYIYIWFPAHKGLQDTEQQPTGWPHEKS